MAYLYCDLGETEVACGLPDGPLQFDEDGLADVDDDEADRIVATHKHIHIADTALDNADESDEDEGDGFDAEAFVDRTPMDDVIADIGSGEYDDRLDAIAAAEADDRDREGVADAIDAREE